MGLGAATDACEALMIQAALGLLPSASRPDKLTFHVSMTPVGDDGSGVSEFSGDTYAPVDAPGWTAAASVASGAPGTRWTLSTITANVTFPTPTAEWWPAGTDIFPYLTDGAGTVLWYWDWGSQGGVHPGAPLIFRNAGGLDTGFMELVLTNYYAGAITPRFQDIFYERALDAITRAASHAAISQWYAAIYEGIPPFTPRTPFSFDFVTAGGIAGGMAEAHNHAAIVLSTTHNPGVDRQIVVGDSANENTTADTLQARFAGMNATFTGSDTLTVPAGALRIRQE